MWKTAPKNRKCASRNQPNDGSPDQRGGREQAPQAEGTEAAPAPAPTPPNDAKRRRNEAAGARCGRQRTTQAKRHSAGGGPERGSMSGGRESQQQANPRKTKWPWAPCGRWIVRSAAWVRCRAYGCCWLRVGRWARLPLWSDGGLAGSRCGRGHARGGFLLSGGLVAEPLRGGWETAQKRAD